MPHSKNPEPEGRSPDDSSSDSRSTPPPLRTALATEDRRTLSMRVQLQVLGVYATIGLIILAVLSMLYLAQGFLLPIVVAFLLALFLRPVVSALARAKIPEAVGAALVLLVTLGGIGYGTYRLAGPAAEWMENAPSNLREFEYKLRGLKEPVERMSEATKEMEKLTKLDDGAPESRQVQLQRPRLSDVVFSGTRRFMVKAAVTAILLYFLLASGDLFLRKLVRVLPRLKEKKQAVEVAHDIQKQVSRYLFAFSLINISLGLAVAGGMMILGMPNPFLWGAVAGVLNFVPYLGPIVTFSVISVVSVLTFEGLGRIAVAPLTYAALNLIESSLVTPIVLGRQLMLNPVAIFIALSFWGWMWGIPGALLAVPLLVFLKILCDHVEPLQPLGEFLGR